MYRIEYLEVHSGLDKVPTATLRLNKDGESLTDATVGKGSTDAVWNVIAKLTGTNCRPTGPIVTAMGDPAKPDFRVEVKLRSQDGAHKGSGYSPDIIQAYATAVISALNSLEAARA